MQELKKKLEQIDKETAWLEIAKQSTMEKQIEIRAELRRCIKRIEKELNRANNS